MFASMLGCVKAARLRAAPLARGCGFRSQAALLATVPELPLFDREDVARLDPDVPNDADPARLILELCVVTPRRDAGDAQPLVVVDGSVAVVDALVRAIAVRARRREI